MGMHFFKKHTCPYCFKKFRFWEAPFSCTAPEVACNRKEPLKIEPLFFGKSIWQGSAHMACPECCHTTSKQMCVHCGKPLFAEYFKAKTILVSLVGFDTEIVSAYKEKLVRHMEKFGTSPWVMCKYDAVEEAFLLRSEKSSVWVRFASMSYEQANVETLAHAQHIFLFLEENTSERALKFLEAKEKILHKKHMAIIWPHLDKIESFLPKTHLFLSQESDFKQIHMETTGIIGSYLGLNFLRYINKNCRNAMCFAMTLSPRQETGWRVADPLLQALGKERSSLVRKVFKSHLTLET